MLTRRRFLQMAGAGVAGTALLGTSGCGGGGSGGGTLTYWSMWNEEEPQQKVLQRTIDEFQKANPDITVDVLWGGREVLTKVRGALATGEGPDLVDKDAEELVGALVYADQAMPLEDVISAEIPGEDGKAIADVIPGSYLDLLAYKGERYLIPYEALSSGVWHSGSQFEEWGIQTPGTWDDLMRINGEIENRGVHPFTVDGNIPFYNAYWYYWLAARLAGPGSLAEAAGDKSGEAWDSPQLSEAASRVEEFVASGALAPGYEGNKYPSAQDAWAQGKAAMYLCGTWLPSETTPQAPNYDYRMFGFPSLPGGEDSVELYLIGWVVPKAAQNPEAAKKFISFAMNKERLRGIVDDAQNLTPRPDMPSPPNLEDAKELLDSGRPVHRVYDGLQALQPGWWEQVFLPTHDRLFFGELGAEEFISRIKEESVKYWDRNES